MSNDRTVRAADGPAHGAGLPVELVVKWLIGLRLVAISALVVGALLVQTTTEEILPIIPLIRVAGLTYLLSLIWLGLWITGRPPHVQAAAQILGDMGIVTTLVYLTGGIVSPFAFLFMVVVGVAALLFQLRGALTVAGGSFVLLGLTGELMAWGVLPSPTFLVGIPQVASSSRAFQLFVTGGGFGLVALLTSYLAHSLQIAETRLRGERKEKDRLLALSADVLRSVDSGVLAVDTDGRVVLANAAAHRILGGESPVADASLSDLLSLGDRQWESVLSELAGGTPIRLEASVTGRESVLGCTVTPLTGESGAALGYVVHFRDLTEAREEARRERLQERMAAVGEMAAGIAHEIRNPLASISGSAQMLTRSGGLKESERRLSRILVEESHRLSGIIEAFLGFARPPDPQRGPCNVAMILEDTLTLFSNSPEVSERHSLSWGIEPHGDTVLADERQLRQAFFNLARNAIQAMPEGGTMRVEGMPEGDHYMVCWHDEGVGMEPGQINEIFQPFKAFRTGGTGLGLAVVYSIVSEHQGEVRVESVPGKGTTFLIRLPLVPS